MHRDTNDFIVGSGPTPLIISPTGGIWGTDSAWSNYTFKYQRPRQKLTSRGPGVSGHNRVAEPPREPLLPSLCPHRQ